jgi:hypothetical protein
MPTIRPGGPTLVGRKRVRDESGFATLPISNFLEADTGLICYLIG